VRARPQDSQRTNVRNGKSGGARAAAASCSARDRTALPAPGRTGRRKSAARNHRAWRERRTRARPRCRVQLLAQQHSDRADEAIQRYLADRSYPNVLVHCMKDHCRNNVGNWPTREVAAPRGAGTSTTTPSRTARWLRQRSTDSCSAMARARVPSTTSSTCHAITSRSSSTSRQRSSLNDPDLCRSHRSSRTGRFVQRAANRQRAALRGPVASGSWLTLA